MISYIYATNKVNISYSFNILLRCMNQVFIYKVFGVEKFKLYLFKFSNLKSKENKNYKKEIECRKYKMKFK